MGVSLQELKTIVRSISIQAWRYRWFGVIAAVVLLSGGWVFISSQSDIWEAKAKVYINPPSELRRILNRQVVESNVVDRFGLVQQTMLGTVQLEKAVRSTGVYGYVPGHPETLDLAVEVLRRNLVLTYAQDNSRTRYRRNDDAGRTYLISFTYPDPQKGIEVIDFLLSQMLDLILGGTGTSVENASEFLSGQVDYLETNLREVEKALSQFAGNNLDHSYLSPAELQLAYQEVLDLLRGQKQSLQLAQSRLSQVSAQLAVEPMHSVGEESAGSVAAQLSQLSIEFAELRARFTDEHPEVKRMEKLIEATQSLEGSPRSLAPTNPVYQALEITRNEIETEIAGIESEISSSESRVGELSSKLQGISSLNAEYNALLREQARLSAAYTELQQSLEREKLSREVAVVESSNFEFIDPPSAGNQPVAPNRPLLMGILILGSLSTLALVPFGISRLSPSFSLQSLNDEDRNLGHITLLGTIGLAELKGIQSNFTSERAVYLLAVAMVLILAASLFMIEIYG